VAWLALAARDVGFERSLVFPGKVEFASERIDDDETQIVPGAIVLPARIAQAGHD